MTLSLIGSAGMARFARGAILDVRAQPFVRAARIDVVPSSLVICSKARSARSVWPASEMTISVPTTRRLLLRSNCNSMTSLPTTICSSIAWLVVLISTEKVPSMSTAPPGTFTSIVACRRPARPRSLTRKTPEPSVTEMIGSPAEPSSRLTSLSATVMTDAPSASMPCSKATLPRRVWPAIVRAIVTETVPSSSTRTSRDRKSTRLNSSHSSVSRMPSSA